MAEERSELDPADLQDASDLDRGAETDRLVGRTVEGRFKLRRMIARGGMGKVYEAEQIPLGRAVAVKVMDLGYSNDLDPGFQKRFFLEAATAARLSHPNTIRIFDYGHEEPDLFYIVMELVVGRTLLDLINAEAPLEPRRVTHITRQMCSSLSEAHSQGIVHRDLKPSNVLITRHGEDGDFVKVLDFGLVKLTEGVGEELTQSGLFLGSPNYMSPEQIRGYPVDGRSDIYSLGVLLFMGLTGMSPFRRPTQINVLVAQLEEPPPSFAEARPDHPIPASLEWVTRTCLAKDPNERFADVAELSRALLACDAEQQGLVPPLQDLRLHNGRLVLPEHVAAALERGTWPAPSGIGSTAGPVAPVSSAGTLAAERAGPDDLKPRRRKRRKQSPDIVVVLLVGLLLLALAAVATLVVVLGRSGSPMAGGDPAPESPAEPQGPDEQVDGDSARAADPSGQSDAAARANASDPASEGDSAKAASSTRASSLSAPRSSSPVQPAPRVRATPVDRGGSTSAPASGAEAPSPRPGDGASSPRSASSSSPGGTPIDLGGTPIDPGSAAADPAQEPPANAGSTPPPPPQATPAPPPRKGSDLRDPWQD